MAPLPFAGLKVVEVTGDPAGDMTGYLLAQSGAEVLKLEPTEGSPLRRQGPFRKGKEGDPDASLAFCYYNSNKRSAVLDLGGDNASEALRPLLADADILLIGLQPAELARRGLDLTALAAAYPSLIILSVTPFGLTGPRADWHSSELVALALGGPLHMCGYDDHTIPPILPGGNQAYHIAASFALKAVLLALIDRQQSGSGQIVDVSMHEGCAVTVELANPYWFYPRALVQRQTCRHAQPSPTQPALFECADGRYVYFALMLAEPRPWAALVEWMSEFGMAAQLSDPAFAGFAYRQTRYPEVQSIVECFFLILDAETIFREGQARGLPVAIVTAPEELLADEHLNARGFFVDVEHDGARYRYPGPAYRFTGQATVSRVAAPKLGEHQALLDR
jgi:crotonobetainyl-CoA:carnitine CoA-transferase CaiB-like acyl-CoA transferase